jgi:hypothetical protein
MQEVDMGRTVAVVVGVIAIAGLSGSAHHGYANYVTEHRIVIEGDLGDIQVGNPRVVMRIKTADSTVYTCIWQGAYWVKMVAHVTASTFKVGDHLIIEGVPSKNPDVKELASLREVRRPSDGWAWHTCNDARSGAAMEGYSRGAHADRARHSKVLDVADCRSILL